MPPKREKIGHTLATFSTNKFQPWQQGCMHTDTTYALIGMQRKPQSHTMVKHSHPKNCNLTALNTTILYRQKQKNMETSEHIFPLKTHIYLKSKNQAKSKNP